MKALRLCVIPAILFASTLPAVRAQDILAPPPDLNLDELGELPRSLVRPNSGLGAGPGSITRGQTEQIPTGEALDPVPEEGLLLFDPAEVWSSRSWLERGYWYSISEAVITAREWDRKNVLLAADFGNANIGAPTTRNLQIRTRHPAAVANARLTLGRFLFRDTENRDHLLETTFFGFGKEFQDGSVTSLNENSLFVPSGQPSDNPQTPQVDVLPNLAQGNLAFSGSNRQAFTYTHELESLEFNYRVRQRRDRDWMTLRPNGEWVRQASPGLLKEFLAGVRWVSADEWLDWTAEGARSGAMRIKANNDLLGVQLGAGASHNFSRWEVSTKGLAGVYTNFARVNRNLLVQGSFGSSGPTPDPGDDIPADPDAVLVNSRTRAEEEDISFLGEFQAVVRYHVHTNFSFRFGYQLMYIDSMALAPFQITFNPGYDQVGLSGSSFYQGWLLGVDGYW